MYSNALLFTFLPIVSAHFQVTWPPSRGFDEDSIVNYPCGGFNTVNSTRQALPLTGQWPIQLSMEHTSVKGMVVLALSNDPSDGDFNIVLREPFQETGPENFCIGDLTLPSSLNVKEGTNATLQIVTNGDPNGGLYACVDVTFTSATLSQSDYNSHCANSTGVSASYIGGSPPNGTSSGSTSSSTGSASASGATAASSSSSKAAGARQTMASFLFGAAGVVGLAAL